MCTAQIENEEEVEGEIELLHLQLVPVDCWKGLYSQREEGGGVGWGAGGRQGGREGGRCTGCVLAHTEYPASNLLLCTRPSPQQLLTLTHVRAQTHQCHVDSRARGGDTSLLRTTRQVRRIHSCLIIRQQVFVEGVSL